MSVKILDSDGTDHGDTAEFWQSSEPRPRHGVDLNLSGREIQVSVTRARRVVRVFVDGVEYRVGAGDGA